MKKRGKRVQEENDLLLEIGKEGKEGIKNFVEYKKAEDKEQTEAEQAVLEEVESKRRKKLEYNQFLRDVLLEELSSLVIPIGWRIHVAPNDIGVIMELKSPDDRIFRSAFGATGDGKIDLNAVHTYALRAEHTLYRMKQDGIIV